MQYYNVHSHIFTMSNAPKDFLQLYLPRPVANAVDRISDTTLGSTILQQALKLAGNGGRRYADFLRIGKSKNQREVLEALIASYPDDPSIRFVALTLNMEFCGAGDSETYFEGQLEEILNIKKEYPDRLLIFLGLDPRWKENGAELCKTVRRYFDTKLYINEFRSVNPFCGLKIYPSTGFYVFDEKLKETFQWAADNGVPVLSHCSYLGGIYNNGPDQVRNNLNPINCYTNNRYEEPKYIEKKNLLRRVLGTNRSRNNMISCSYFLEPCTYEFPLGHFDRSLNKQASNPNPLKICLAHFGGDDQIDAAMIIGGAKKKKKISEEQATPYGVKKLNWHNEIHRILKDYKGAYTDISYAVFNKELYSAFATAADNKDYGKKVLFGTDFFLTERVNKQAKIYNDFKSYATQYQLKTGAGNLWDRIAGENVGEFLRSNYYP